jgi:hypothetical protein
MPKERKKRAEKAEKRILQINKCREVYPSEDKRDKKFKYWESKADLGKRGYRVDMGLFFYSFVVLLVGVCIIGAWY